MLVELGLEGGVGLLGVTLDVHQQLELSVPPRVHAAGPAVHQLIERIEIEAFERDSSSDICEVVGYEKLAVDQPYVRFDTGEAVLEGIEQRAVVFVVVVGVRCLAGGPEDNVIRRLRRVRRNGNGDSERRADK
ncbi:hypothetical protein [Arthrobacter sp. MDT1-65]